MSSDILKASVILVGPGRAGRAFARSWRGAGGELREVPGRAEVSSATNLRGDILILAVPDDAISSTASRLAPVVTCQSAFHFSGALPAEVLAALRSRGASLGSLHPLKAFSGSASEDWLGAFVAVEGDSRAVELGTAIASAIGAEARQIPSEGKPLYHAAATLAAGGSVALVSLAARMWSSLGLPEAEARRALAGLGVQALEALSQREFHEAWTGPIARRDLGTVTAHQKVLARFPEARAVYKALARETLSRTPGRGMEKEIRDVFSAVEPESGNPDR
jgi:predicted short-subunit dehydrogenase-like oxidoreductase (DUF2520 family)